MSGKDWSKQKSGLDVDYSVMSRKDWSAFFVREGSMGQKELFLRRWWFKSSFCTSFVEANLVRV